MIELCEGFRYEFIIAGRCSLILLAAGVFSCSVATTAQDDGVALGGGGANSAAGGQPAGVGGQPAGVGGETSLPQAGGSAGAPMSSNGSQGGRSPVASGGTAAAGGTATSGGSAGEGAAAATGGSAGAAGAEGGTAGMAVNSGSFQADPGAEGDGTFEQAGPYKRSPEMAGPINGAPKGKLSGSKSFASPAVYAGWTFEYWIYVPSQYEAGKPAALAVMQDGVSQYEGDINITPVFDNLIHAGEMPVTIGLFVRSGVEGGTRKRVENYDTVSERYGKMLIEEMIPAVLSDYDIVDDPDGWSIGGHSSGGVAAFSAAWFWPDAFRKVFTNSGSFVDISGADVYPQLIREAPPKPLRVGLRSGTKDLSDNRGSWFDANVQMAEALAEKGYHHRLVKGTGGHSMDHAAQDIADELRWLWRGYKLPHYP